MRRSRASWPRIIVARETEQIGVVDRRRGRDGRPAWAILDQADEAVATVREASFGTAVARRSLSIGVSTVAALLTLGNAQPSSRPRTEFLVSGPSRPLGEIRGGAVLDLTGDPARELDRRLAVAAFVAIVLAEEGY